MSRSCPGRRTWIWTTSACRPVSLARFPALPSPAAGRWRAADARAGQEGSATQNLRAEADVGPHEGRAPPSRSGRGPGCPHAACGREAALRLVVGLASKRAKIAAGAIECFRSLRTLFSQGLAVTWPAPSLCGARHGQGKQSAIQIRSSEACATIHAELNTARSAKPCKGEWHSRSQWPRDRPAHGERETWSGEEDWPTGEQGARQGPCR